MASRVSHSSWAWRVSMSFDDQISEGDRVVTRWTGQGTHLGELNGIPATGRAAQVWGVFIHRLAAGQITETWTSFDGLGLLHQLGVIPAQAAPPATSAQDPVSGSTGRPLDQ